MFRKSTLLVSALALMLLAPLAHAAKGDVNLGVGGGLLMPLSDFKDVAKMGFLGALDMDYMVTDAVALGVDAMYSKNSAKDDLVTFLGVDEASVTMLAGGGHVKYMFPMAAESKIMPYVVGGGGIYHVTFKAELAGASDSDSENKFGGRGGVGMNFKAGEKLNVNAEANFHVVSTSDASTKFATFRVGVSFPLTGAK